MLLIWLEWTFFLYHSAIVHIVEWASLISQKPSGTTSQYEESIKVSTYLSDNAFQLYKLRACNSRKTDQHLREGYGMRRIGGGGEGGERELHFTRK